MKLTTDLSIHVRNLQYWKEHMLYCIQCGRANTSYMNICGKFNLDYIKIYIEKRFAYVKIPTTPFHCAHRSPWPLFNIIHVNMHKLSNLEDFHTNNKNCKSITAKSKDLKM